MWNQHGFFLWVCVSVTLSQEFEDFNSERDPVATLQTIHSNTKKAFSCIRQCGHVVSTDSNTFTGRTALGAANSGTTEQAETFVYDRHSFHDAYRF
jgi:hypothetical protein